MTEIRKYVIYGMPQENRKINNVKREENTHTVNNDERQREREKKKKLSHRNFVVFKWSFYSNENGLGGFNYTFSLTTKCRHTDHSLLSRSMLEILIFARINAAHQCTNTETQTDKHTPHSIGGQAKSASKSGPANATTNNHNNNAKNEKSQVIGNLLR